MGNGQLGGVADELPLAASCPLPAARWQVVWLNFAGGSSGSGWAFTQAVPAFDATAFGLPADQQQALIDATLAAVLDQWVTGGSLEDPETALNLPVAFTLTEPATGPFTAIYIGGAGPALGLAQADPGNLDPAGEARVYSDTLAALPLAQGGVHRDNLQEAAQALANTISHELGHTLGLDHLGATADGTIMQAGAVDDSRIDVERFSATPQFTETGTWQSDLTVLWAALGSTAGSWQLAAGSEQDATEPSWQLAAGSEQGSAAGSEQLAAGSEHDGTDQSWQLVGGSEQDENHELFDADEVLTDDLADDPDDLMPAAGWEYDPATGALALQGPATGAGWIWDAVAGRLVRT